MSKSEQFKIFLEKYEDAYLNRVINKNELLKAILLINERFGKPLNERYIKNQVGYFCNHA